MKKNTEKTCQGDMKLSLKIIRFTIFTKIRKVQGNCGVRERFKTMSEISCNFGVPANTLSSWI